MTCLVAWRGRYATMVGTDSQWTAGPEKGKVIEGKMWRNGRFLIAAAGSVRAMQVLKYGTQFDPRVADASLQQHLITAWVPEVFKTFDQSGLLTKDEDKTVMAHLEVLVVSRRKIMRVGGDFTVIDDPLHYAAGGSGEGVALGYLAAQSRSDSEYQVVKGALQTAVRHAAGVEGPFHIERVR